MSSRVLDWIDEHPVRFILLAAALTFAASCGPVKPPQPPASPPPTAPPPSPPPSGRRAVMSLRVHPVHPHCLELALAGQDPKPWLPYGYGNAVPAFGDSHPWMGDIELCIAQGCDYLRLWAFLPSDSKDSPWLKLPNGKYDLTQRNPAFWRTVAEVLTETKAKGIVLEPMVYDRGLGGSTGDYHAHPFHPSNNVNGLAGELPDGGTGTPEFYQAKPGGKLLALQELYEGWWVEACRGFPNCVLEAENEHRSNEIDFGRRVANRIKSLNPKQLVSYSTLGEDLEKAYGVASIDVVNPHFGNDGVPDVLDAFCRDHWSKGITNVDEFFNGFGDPKEAMEAAKRLEAAGCGFHFEDAKASAKPELAAKFARDTSAARAQHACITGPTGPGPTCPKETSRGAAFYRADWNGGSCTGHDECRKQNDTLGFPRGVKVAYDSTPRSGNRPLPGNCPAGRTTWTISPPVPMTTNSNEPFAMQAKFNAPGPYQVCAKGPAAGVCLAVKIK